MNTRDYILNKYNKPESATVHLDIDRDELAVLLYELGCTCGAEIGVERGHYSKRLCEAIPNLSLFCIDPWEVYEDYGDIRDAHRIHIDYAKAIRRLAPYKCTLIRKSSMDAVKEFMVDSLDFVYIDGNHTFPYVWDDITQWYRIVRPGGIVSGHDYIWRAHGKSDLSVGKAVNLFVGQNGISPLFLLDKHGSSTWMFVK